jgi:uncharacterized protein YdhG (YjbR/CyaY superfamily)
MKNYKTVDEYIKKADKKVQDALIEVRSIVQKTVKDADEEIAYGMPSYTWKEKPLFYFAAMKGHLGIYPTPGPIQACRDILKDFSTSKGCVRIPYQSKIPRTIIAKLLKERVREIKAEISSKIK